MSLLAPRAQPYRHQTARSWASTRGWGMSARAHRRRSQPSRRYEHARRPSTNLTQGTTRPPVYVGIIVCDVISASSTSSVACFGSAGPPSSRPPLFPSSTMYSMGTTLFVSQQGGASNISNPFYSTYRVQASGHPSAPFQVSLVLGPNAGWSANLPTSPRVPLRMYSTAVTCANFRLHVLPAKRILILAFGYESKLTQSFQ